MAASPSFREAGAGPGIVCLHANASSSTQWRMLMERLAPNFHVLAADSYGHGRSPAPPADRKTTLRDEVALLEPVFARAGEPFHLAAHSYGAGVALVAAVDRPERVRSLILYEPTLFAVLDAEKPAPNEADGIRDVMARSGAALAAGNRPAALPNVRVVEFDGLGHMGPVTHPDVVNSVIAKFVEAG